MLRRDNPHATARFLLAHTPVIFTAGITKVRLIGDFSEMDDPLFEESYEIIDVIKGAVPNAPTMKVASPCDSQADCFKSMNEAETYEDTRIGKSIIVFGDRFE